MATVVDGEFTAQRRALTVLTARVVNRSMLGGNGARRCAFEHCAGRRAEVNMVVKGQGALIDANRATLRPSRHTTVSPSSISVLSISSSSNSDSSSHKVAIRETRGTIR